MSWSFTAFGNPEKVIEALEAHGEKISKNPADQCRVEFEAAKPHLVGLVKLNHADTNHLGFTKAGIKLVASGSAQVRTVTGEAGSRVVQSNVQVALEGLGYGFVG